MHTPKASLCDASEINEIYMTGIFCTGNMSYRSLNCINYSSLPVLKTCTLSKTANGRRQTRHRPQENSCRLPPLITKLVITLHICVGIFYSEFYKNRVKSAENRKEFHLHLYVQYVFLRTPSHDS